MLMNRTRRLSRILSLDDFETAARKVLPRPVFGYIAGAAEDSVSFRQNRECFQDYNFVPNVLVDISKRSTEAKLLGKTYSAPFGIAPFGLSALAAYRGDIVLAAAAAKRQIPMIMSGSSLIRLEEVAQVSPTIAIQSEFHDAFGCDNSDWVSFLGMLLSMPITVFLIAGSKSE